MRLLTARFKYWYWIALLSVFSALAFASIPKEYYDVGGDSAQYIILGESLSQGKGFRMQNVPGEPFSSYYPPVFPLLLAPILYFLGRNFYCMHLVIIVLGCASLFFSYRIVKQCANTLIASATVIFLGMNWCFLLYTTNYILSDIPYLFFSSATLACALGYVKSNTVFDHKGLFTVTGLLLSYFTRYAGLTLWIALTIYLLTQKNDPAKNKKMLLVGISFFSAALLWKCAVSLAATHSPSHFGQFFLVDPYAPSEGSILSKPLFILVRFVEGVNYYYRIIADIVSVPFLPAGLPRELVSGLIFVTMLVGFWYSFKQERSRLLHYYFIAYFLLIIIWPFREGARFVLPILPIILCFLFMGLAHMTRLIFRRGALPSLYCVLLGMSALNGFNAVQVYRGVGAGEKSLAPPVKNFLDLQKWIKAYIPQEGTIFSRKPTITYFYTGHQSLTYPFTRDPAVFSDALAKNRVRYVVVDEFSRETARYLVPNLQADKQKFRVLRRIGNTGILEVLK